MVLADFFLFWSFFFRRSLVLVGFFVLVVLFGFDRLSDATVFSFPCGFPHSVLHSAFPVAFRMGIHLCIPIQPRHSLRHSAFLAAFRIPHSLHSLRYSAFPAAFRFPCGFPHSLRHSAFPVAAIKAGDRYIESEWPPESG